MKKIAYLDCPSGLAGDMCLGALVHAGVPFDYLSQQLKQLGLNDEYELMLETVHHNGLVATKVKVKLLQAEQPFELYESVGFGEGKVEGVDRKGVDGGLVNSKGSDGEQGEHDRSHDQARRQVHDSGNGSDSAAIAPPHPHPHSHPHPHNHAHGHPSTHSPTPPLLTPHSHPHTRHLPEIEHLIQSAQLPPRATAWSLAVFRKLAEAEAAVHGVTPDQVHFHEVGATDAIVDIVGTCLGLDWLGIDELYCSPLPTGGGTVRAAHGILPVPTPAVLKLYELRQIPIYSNGIQRELVTPTGAAIVTAIATHFGDPPPMTLQKIGLGAGTRTLPIPNMVRLWLGITPNTPTVTAKNTHTTLHTHPIHSSTHTPTHPSTPLSPSPSRPSPHQPSITHSSSSPSSTHPPTHPSTPPSSLFTPHPSPTDTITLLQTQLDDLNPQAIGYIYDKLFQIGALDVFTQAIGMKKSRPGILLSVICPPDHVQACEQVIFAETTTLGIRRTTQQRTVLHRFWQTVETDYGTVRVKMAQRQPGSPILNLQPEYEDCAAIAHQHQIPWQQVHQAALTAALQLNPQP
ncbi:MAG: nickel pincer cofactor biosynthesis protein LarC [Thainema sp.]